MVRVKQEKTLSHAHSHTVQFVLTRSRLNIQPVVCALDVEDQGHFSIFWSPKICIFDLHHTMTASHLAATQLIRIDEDTSMALNQCIIIWPCIVKKDYKFKKCLKIERSRSNYLWCLDLD